MLFINDSANRRRIRPRQPCSLKALKDATNQDVSFSLVQLQLFANILRYFNCTRVLDKSPASRFSQANVPTAGTAEVAKLSSSFHAPSWLNFKLNLAPILACLD